MKRFITTLLCVIMLLSIAITPAFAAEDTSAYVDTNVSDSSPIEIIDGSFTSGGSQLEYQVTADFSNEIEYCLGFIRTGRGGFTVSIYDESGKYITGGNCSGPDPVQTVGGQAYLLRPTTSTQKYTYTVTVATPSYLYVEGDTSFRLAFGPSPEKAFFFEGIENCMYLPYYHRYHNSKQDLASYKSMNSVSTEGFYYKIDAKGKETVTLATDQDQYNFRVLRDNGGKLEEIFDSKTIGSWKIDGLGGYYSVKTVDFTPGGTYYVVVYANGKGYYKGAYTITVGDHRTHYQQVDFNVPARTVTANRPFETTFNILAPSNEGQTYAWRLDYRPADAGKTQSFEVLTPGTSRWQSFSLRGLDFGFENEYAPLVNATGDWILKVTPGFSGSYKGGVIHFYYYADIT